ncbi:Rha family transcriptional regulator [Pseudomonas sp. A-RE-19]|uniref:Rha family transcriptional regulator n=1 Tax=Pseudomonas sp. A-RE-19 TaxID=2832401 RepID=UPI001CBBB0FC|nr:phage regulatory protein/antirepressor Ant [Pseudomonas sp. A-RE-19]
MSSREVAELIGSKHDNVLKTVRALVAKGVVSANDTAYIHPQNGQVYREFLLSQRDTLVVVSGYSVELRARIIDRWQELEAQVGQFQIPATYAEALQAAADQAKDNQSLRLVILDQAPKVAAIKRLAAASGAICITGAAKHLQLQPSKLFNWMEQHRWIFRRQGSGRWTAYQPRITSGYMIHKVTSLKADPATGAERAAFDPLVTPKGLVRLAEFNIGASL